MSNHITNKHSHWSIADERAADTEHDLWCIHHPRNRFALVGIVADEIFTDDEGRWYARGFDVTDVAFGWTCRNGHQYRETIPALLAGARCPRCGA